MPVIGFLGLASADRYAAQLTSFHQGLHDSGFRERQNVAVEYRWAGDRFNPLPELAAELVRQSVNVIFAANGPAAVAAKAATSHIPIVFQAGFDPVAVGLVASLNRPGGNVTGVTTQGLELGPKRLEMLRDLVSGAGQVAALVNNSNALNVERNTRALQTAADALNLKLHILHASASEDFDRVFAAVAKLGPIGLVIAGDQFFTSRIEQLAALSVQHRVPTIFQYREFAVAGGLMSYGTSTTESYRLGAIYVARILKGEKPADLPVQQPTRLELIVNLKTAKTLGLTVPPAILARADEVIE
jgi:putative ABC transport system substrate-binding protein